MSIEEMIRAVPPWIWWPCAALITVAQVITIVDCIRRLCARSPGEGRGEGGGR